MGEEQTIAFVTGDGGAIVSSIEGRRDDLVVRTVDSVDDIPSTSPVEPDVVLLEHSHTVDAFESLGRLRDRGSGRPVMVFSPERDADVAAKAANADVDGYVHGSETPDRTAKAIVDLVDSIGDEAFREERKRKLERYETIVEASGDPVYTLDADGYVTFANEALATMTGLDLEDVVGHHVSELMRDAHIERGNQLIREILESDDLTWGTFEMDVETVDGDTLTCENHVALLPFSDRFRGTVGILRDVTDRKRREEALQEERDRLTAVFETIPEPIVHVRFSDDEPIVEDVNSTFVDTFGVDVSALNGQSINEAIVPVDVLDEARAIDASADTTDFVETTVQRKTVDGVRDFVLRATRFDVRDGERESIVAYLDITDQKERQRDLERQNERLDQFASVLSHDLRNPLNVATGRVELAQLDCDSPHLHHVSNALDRMERLIQDVLTLAKYGNPVTDEADIELESMARTSWQGVDTGDAATLEVDSDLVFTGNRTRVRSLFENLFRNAIDHCGDDVTVRVTARDSGFAVEDDGPGLPDGDIDVFEGGVSTDPDGTGFGLRIVAEIVEAHGWTITTGEGIDGGTRFEITDVETPS